MTEILSLASGNTDIYIAEQKSAFLVHLLSGTVPDYLLSYRWIVQLGSLQIFFETLWTCLLAILFYVSETLVEAVSAQNASQRIWVCSNLPALVALGLIYCLFTHNLTFPIDRKEVCLESGYLTLPLPSSKSTFSQPFQEKCISEVVRICSIIIFHLSKLWKAKFFILCDVIFLVRLQEKFEFYHS